MAGPAAPERLPIEDVLPDLVRRLGEAGRAVLQAPPGAGKTTRVPLAIDAAGIAPGRVVMLEPRRLAARAATERMAESLGEAAGETVGYRIRGEARVTSRTRIEVVTEGILARMIRADPALPGIGAVIFDEFHERSLDADLGLALVLEVGAALRPDLLLLVMSATLDAAPVAALLGGAPVITAEGRVFPVETRHLDRPLAGRTRFEAAMADLIETAAGTDDGAILAFLPGAREIARTAALLDGRLPGIDVLPLHGSLPFTEQKRALRPSGRRRLVLATSIAETSLTIPDVRIVVDGGLARRARFDPGRGMTRLVTERASRAEADQRRGRAGRVAPGTCWRLWSAAEEGVMPPAPPPEIETADLAPLALALADWGSDDLSFPTPPPAGPLASARRLLADLGALEGGGITPHGRAMADLPAHPRLAHMLIAAGRGAAPLAALLGDRDPLRGEGADLALRLQLLGGPGRDPGLDRIRREARRLSRLAPPGRIADPGAQAALAYPDRVAQRRPGDAPRFLLANGTGARLPENDALAGEPWLVVAETDGRATDATIRLALPVAETTLREVLAPRISETALVRWSARDDRVVAAIEERLGALTLASRPWPDAPPEALADALAEGLRRRGLPLSPEARRLQARARLLREGGHDLPDLSDEALLADLPGWLAPWLAGCRSGADLDALDLLPALHARLGHAGRTLLDREAPASFRTPLGRAVPIDYSGEAPEIAVRLQEMFGTTRHPAVAGRPLRVTLLSPAGRPLQTTMDLPGFWATSYADVRKDMRGRYPKHPWPEDPAAAAPTLRTRGR